MAETIEIAYLGPSIDHLSSLRSMMEKSSLNLTVVPDSLTWARNKPQPDASVLPRVAARLGRARAQWSGTRDPGYLAHALDGIDRKGITHILAFWGTGPLPEIQAIKRLRPHLKIVLNLLCHPLGLTPTKVAVQNFLLGHACASLDGIVVSSAVMQHNLLRTVPAARRVPIFLLPPCWPREFGPKLDLPPLAPRPGVIFLGRMDWRSGQPSDNVTDSLRLLMGEGVDVHFVKSRESDIREPHACPFDPVPLAEAADFAAPFDTSLIIYNLSAVKVKDRFEVTIPDRLITSVSAGVPIAIPAEGYAACKEYLRDYAATLQYTSMPQLAEQLRDRSRIRDLRLAARENSRLYRAELHFPNLLAFLHQL